MQVSESYIPVLRELHDEKDRRENQELRAQRDDKSSSKNSSTESLTDKPKDKKTSPLKFLQENLVEKMKKIPKPNEIKEKIQKMNRDSQGEPSTSKYNQEYVFDRETSSNEEIKTVSVASDLPPVIKLDSPDLMSIEVAIDAIKMDMKKRSSVEQFASLVDSESQQNNEAETMSYQSTSKTGSGAHSALKRLQSEHLEEENSDTVLHRKSFSEDSVELTTSDLHSSNEIKTDVSDTGQSFPLQTATAVMPEEEGIVFSRKIKHKGKKKKKGE